MKTREYKSTKRSAFISSEKVAVLWLLLFENSRAADCLAIMLFAEQKYYNFVHISTVARNMLFVLCLKVSLSIKRFIQTKQLIVPVADGFENCV
jgi:hypothetical protein